jgi:hypothetical protein
MCERGGGPPSAEMFTLVTFALQKMRRVFCDQCIRCFCAQKRCADGIVNEPGTRSSRRELLNFPSRPAFSTVHFVVRNTKKANPNLLVLSGNSCQTVPTRLVVGSRLPLAVLRNAFSSQTSTRVVSAFPDFYRIIRSLPDHGSYAEIDLMTTSRSPLVSLCDAPLFLRERRNRFSAPARSNRPQAEYDRHRLHIRRK